MLTKKTRPGIFLASTLIVLLSGCYKTVSLSKSAGTEVTNTVSFKTDLIPIFNASCNMGGCHSTGGQVPDLTPNNAYRTLFEEDLIDVNDPAGSEVMGWLTGEIKPAMPLGAQTNPSNINNIMLAWIKQGAKNN